MTNICYYCDILNVKTNFVIITHVIIRDHSHLSWHTTLTFAWVDLTSTPPECSYSLLGNPAPQPRYAPLDIPSSGYWQWCTLRLVLRWANYSCVIAVLDLETAWGHRKELATLPDSHATTHRCHVQRIDIAHLKQS